MLSLTFEAPAVMPSLEYLRSPADNKNNNNNTWLPIDIKNCLPVPLQFVSCIKSEFLCPEPEAPCSEAKEIQKREKKKRLMLDPDLLNPYTNERE
jgi:hypothetical protein